MKPRILKRAVETARALCPTNWKNVNNSHIAFLVRKNKIIKIGWNRKRTHPEIVKHPYHDGYVGTHAELDVILKSGLDIKTENLYSNRIATLDKMLKHTQDLMETFKKGE